MVNGDKIKRKFIVITLSVITVFLFGTGSFLEAKAIGDQEVSAIKTFLKIADVPFLSDFTGTEIKQALSGPLFSEEPDLTFGVLVLATIDELEFMDMILTQGYKDIGSEYFNGILNKKLNLISSWQKTGKNIKYLIEKGKSVTPLTALAMESVEMVNKTIEIFSVFTTVKEMKKYDGLWYYFDLRKNGNEPHKVAWEEALEWMGWAAKSASFYSNIKTENQNQNQLESQFLTLWEKWGPYITPYGISKEYKEKLVGELNKTLAIALQERALVKREELSKSSLVDKAKSSLAKLTQELAKIKDQIVSLILQNNSFKAGPLVEIPQIKTEVIPLDYSKLELLESAPPEIQKASSLAELQEDLDDVLEEMDILQQEVNIKLAIAKPIEAEPSMDRVGPQSIETEEIEEGLEKNDKESVEVENEEEESEPEPTFSELDSEKINTVPDGVQFCDRAIAGFPLMNRVIINEVAWMGTERSSSDEWIELKNISREPVSLAGWQITDKGKQIKVVFKENDVIPAYGFYILERTDDNSLPYIPANFIYTGALNDNAEAINLFNNNCGLEDEISAFPNWPAGDKAEKRSMERDAKLYWHTYYGLPIDDIFGTPNRENTLPLSYPLAVVSSGGPSSSPPPEETVPPEQEPEVEQPLLSVVINEIAWMGNATSSQDEWIELYNNSQEEVDLTGWTLTWSHSTTTHSIVFSTSTCATTTIPALGFYLIERTDDNTISDIIADLITSFGHGLNNGGEKIDLRDSSGALIDIVDCSEGWFGGKASPGYVSMERISPQLKGDVGNWADNNRVPWLGWDGKDVAGNRIFGTPKSKNSVAKTFTAIASGGFTTEDDFILTKLGSPYLIDGTINVASSTKLTIEPGVIIKFKENSYTHSGINIEGELESIGTGDQKIVITSYKDDEYGGDTNEDGVTTIPSAGDWDWIYSVNPDKEIKMENVIVRYGGKYHQSCCFEYSPYTKGMIKIDNGGISIKDSIIENSYTRGIWLEGALATIENVQFVNNLGENYLDSAGLYINSSEKVVSVKNSTFKGNKSGVWIESGNHLIDGNLFEDNQLAAVKSNNLSTVFSNNITQNNNYNGVLLSGFSFPEEVDEINWNSADLPYIIESTIYIPEGKTLNIGPGVVIKLNNSGQVSTTGTLKVQGQESNKVIFTALADDEYGGDTNNNGSDSQPAPGHWHSISFSGTDTNSIIDNAIIRYGGWYNVFLGGADAKGGAIKVKEALLTIKNSLIENNLFAGLQLVNATTTMESVVFNKNENGIYIELGECPDLSGVTFGVDEDENTENRDVFPKSCRE